jgi:hypothetical protein
LRHVGAHRHIQMFGCEFTYCNVHIPQNARKARIAWGNEQIKAVCADCRRELDRALKAAFT